MGAYFRTSSTISLRSSTVSFFSVSSTTPETFSSASGIVRVVPSSLNNLSPPFGSYNVKGFLRSRFGLGRGLARVDRINVRHGIKYYLIRYDQTYRRLDLPRSTSSLPVSVSDDMIISSFHLLISLVVVYIALHIRKVTKEGSVFPNPLVPQSKG